MSSDEMTTVPTLSDLVQYVANLVEHPQIRTHDNALHVRGPDGVYRISQRLVAPPSCTALPRYILRITLPNREGVLHSLSALRARVHDIGVNMASNPVPTSNVTSTSPSYTPTSPSYSPTDPDPAPVSAPVSAPVAAPGSPPVSAPVSAPVAAPGSAPVSAPVSDPVSDSVSNPVSNLTPAVKVHSYPFVKHAAMTIQMRVRYMQWQRSSHALAAARAAHAPIQQRLVAIATQLQATHVADPRLAERLHISYGYTHSTRYSLLSSLDPMVPNSVGSLCTFLNTSRSAMDAMVTNILTTSSSAKATATVCAKSMSKQKHYPLVVGSVKGPVPGLRMVDVDTPHVHATYLVEIRHHLTAVHMSLIASRFGIAFANKIKSTFADPACLSFAVDFYANRTKAKLLGGLVLTKIIVKQYGEYFPAISIETIATPSTNTNNEERHTGTAMFFFVKRLLHADPFPYHNAAKGYIFAQCIKIGWWSHLLYEDGDAKALILQMHQHYPSWYGLYYNLSLRCRPFNLNEADESPNKTRFVKKCNYNGASSS